MRKDPARAGETSARREFTLLATMEAIHRGVADVYRAAPLDVNAFEESALKLATEAVRNAGMAEFLASIGGADAGEWF